MAQSETSRVDHIIDIARGAAPAGPSDRENRVATRIPYTVEIALVQIAPSGEKNSPIIIRGENISTGGLCVLSPRDLSAGGRGAVLIAKSNGESVVIGARVIYSNSRGSQGFECGIQFETELPVVSMDDFRNDTGELPRLGPALAA